ncbi:MAG: hypothetical protein EOO86_18615 [Pedobacter sp.]|nr:MAG: hypothetical protein EOO86_18615 [Pedobacter sp.]
MKKIITCLFLLVIVFSQANAQIDAYKGKEDLRFQIGANMQKWGTGIVTSLDYGLGQSFSIGAQAGYLLGVKSFPGIEKGGRVFFDKGFGLFTEAQFPIAKYNSDAIGYERLNNQFSFNIGVAFDLGK